MSGYVYEPYVYRGKICDEASKKKKTFKPLWKCGKKLILSLHCSSNILMTDSYFTSLEHVEYLKA
jgi:hypothetical protein